MLHVYSPNDAAKLTCEPDACVPSDLDAGEVTLAGTGASYQLGPAFFTQDQVASASATSADDGLTWYVELTLDADGTKGLSDASKDALDEQPEGRIALVVGGKVWTAPAVQNVVKSGLVQLSGFTQAEAQQLADALNA